MTLLDKLARLANSQQGRKLINQAREVANDPQRRQQAKDAVEKLRTKATEAAEQARKKSR